MSAEIERMISLAMRKMTDEQIDRYVESLMRHGSVMIRTTGSVENPLDIEVITPDQLYRSSDEVDDAR